MRWSLKIARVAGIGIYVHWTFLLIIAFIVWIAARQGAGVAGAIYAVAFVLALFVCIVLHELGHALTAKRFGYQTKDITLLVIGGLARFERMPEKPSQEFLVAIAGPAVNVVIAAALFVVVASMGWWSELPQTAEEAEQFTFTDLNFAHWLLMANVFIVGFNLLPAFPMDGGRVLRAILASRLDYATATRVAANVGQLLAIAFFLLGLLAGSIILMLIAVFVFLGAQAEAASAESKAAFRGLTAEEGMVTRYRALSPHETLADASEELLAGTQQDFPVVDGDGQLVGILPRGDLVRALAQQGLGAEVGRIMRTECALAEADEPLSEALERMRAGGCGMAPVMRDGRLIGLLTPDNVTEVMMLRSALRRRGVEDLEAIWRASG